MTGQQRPQLSFLMGAKSPLGRRSLLIGGAAAVAGCFIAGSSPASPQGATTDNRPAATVLSGTVRVAGISIYYEVHGGPLTANRTPFVLMHGGLMTIETAFAGDLLPKLSALAPTIAIESQGHGLPDRPGDAARSIGADVIGVLDHLQVDAVHLPA